MATATLELTENKSTSTAEKEKPKYKPGVLAGVEVSNQKDADLSEAAKTALGMLRVKATKRDNPARLIEVIQAWEAALFYRGFQFLIPQRGGGWLIPGESTGYGPSMQMDLALLPTNIYSANAQILIATLTRSVPAVRFQPQDASKNQQITASESAEKFIKVLERNNDLIMIQTDAARYLWTDGRALYYTRFVKDGQRFGWEEDDTPDNIVPEDEPSTEQTDQIVASGEEKSVEGQSESEEGEDNHADKSDDENEEEMEDILANRTPRGQEVRTAHGKLEVKLVPMMANTLDEVQVLQYETEVDQSTAKGMFLEVADQIRAGNNGISEGEIARLARQNVKLGMQSTYITSDSTSDDVTIQRNWIRPSYFMHVQNLDTRNELIMKFPDGVLVTYAGDTFCYARNESIDDSWALMQAYSGDGQNRNALGTSLMPIQKRLNNWLDLMNDFFVRAVPKKWMHNKAFNVEALRQQTNVPGDIGSFKPQQGLSVTDLIFVEPSVQAPTSLPDFVKEYSGPLAELLSGAYPALAGSNVGEGDTATGTAIQRDQALGRLGPTWHSISNAEAKAMRQGVRWGAKCRDGSINEKIPGGETIRLEINDLKADILCYPESDENFPESYPQKQQRLMGVFQDSAKNPELQEVLYNPANLEFLQSMIALSDLYIPQVASWNKQSGELELLVSSGPIPDPTIQQAKDTMMKLVAEHGIDREQLLQAETELHEREQNTPEISSVEVDELDDHATEMMCCWKWMMSPEGRKAKRINKPGFENVKLHYKAHEKAQADKAAQAGAGAGKPPSVSLNYKDTAGPPSPIQAQILSKAGIQPPPPQAAPAPAMAAQ